MTELGSGLIGFCQFLDGWLLVVCVLVVLVKVGFISDPIARILVLKLLFVNINGLFNGGVEHHTALNF